MLVCFGFEGVDRRESVWNTLQTELFKAKSGREQIGKSEGERSHVHAEGPASSLRSRAEICPA